MSNENKVRRGDKRILQATTWNTLIDVAKQAKQQGSKVGAGTPTDPIDPATRVLIQNGVGSLSDSFVVMGLGEPIVDVLEGISDDTTREQFVENVGRRVGFVGIVPVEKKPFAIVQTPAQFGQISTGIIAGITIAFVEMAEEEHEWADCIEGDTNKLRSSAQAGAARILYNVPYDGRFNIAIIQLMGGGSNDTAAIPVETTSTYNTSTGFSWKLLAFDSINNRFVDSDPAVVGNKLFDVADNRAIPVGSRLLMTKLGSIWTCKEFIIPQRPNCLEWYTAYHHLGTMAVSVGQEIPARALIGTVGVPASGAHSHFSLGDGSDFLSNANQAVVGQTLDITDWLLWPSEGTRDPMLPGPLYYPPLFRGSAFSDAAIAYIRSCFTPWLPTEGYKQVYGSLEHFSGEYFAVDVFPEDVDPLDNDNSMEGTPIHLAIGSDAVENTVIFAGEIDPTVLNMVIVRHRVGCCSGPWKGWVRVATTEGGNIDTDYVAGAIVDEVELNVGDEILVKNNGAANRIGIVNSEGPPMYRWDADTGGDYVAAVVAVTEGRVNGGSIWKCANENVVFGETDTIWYPIYDIGFFAKLTATNGTLWKFQKLTSSGGAYTNDGDESPDFCASPLKYNNDDLWVEPYINLRVWMRWGKSEWEFMPMAPTIIEVDCGLYESIDGETGVKTIGVAGEGTDGIEWLPEFCVYTWNPGCGLTVGVSPVNGRPAIAVNFEALAGDNATTGLVVVGTAPVEIGEPCQTLSVDLDEVDDDNATFDKIKSMSITGGDLKIVVERRTISIDYNEAQMPITLTFSAVTEVEFQVPICASDCCEADPLTAECTKSGSGGPAPYDATFTSTPSGGVGPYVYFWVFGDGGTSIDQNPAHTFETAGTYVPYVDITDTCGNTVRCTVGGSIVVTEEGPMKPCGEEELVQWPFRFCFEFTAASGALAGLMGGKIEMVWDGIDSWVGDVADATALGFTSFFLESVPGSPTCVINMVGCVDYGPNGISPNECDPISFTALSGPGPFEGDCMPGAFDIFAYTITAGPC